MAKDVWLRLANRWGANHGYSAAEIQFFIQQRTFGAANELDDLLFLVSLFGKCGSLIDPHGYHFWRADELIALDLFEGGRFAFDEAKKCIVFADYLDFSWGFAFLSGVGVFLIGHASGREIKIADSLMRFIDLYLEDAMELYPC